MSIVIGLGGGKGVGKDLAAKMLLYIHTLGAKASYRDFVTKESIYERNVSRVKVAFADRMKKVCSIMFDIPLEDFEDRDKKDNLWWNLEERRYITEEDANFGMYRKITINMLEVVHLADIDAGKGKTRIIKLRTIMQYIGTVIGRELIADDLWIRPTIVDIKNTAETNGLCIVTDVRLLNEEDRLYKLPETIAIIKINRGEVDTSYITESTTIKGTDVVDNNDTKLQLFHKLSNIYNKRK